jgi:hypothetical protein
VLFSPGSSRFLHNTSLCEPYRTINPPTIFRIWSLLFAYWFRLFPKPCSNKFDSASSWTLRLRSLGFARQSEPCAECRFGVVLRPCCKSHLHSPTITISLELYHRIARMILFLMSLCWSEFCNVTLNVRTDLAARSLHGQWVMMARDVHEFTAVHVYLESGSGPESGRV